jgi:hypothetical protein
MWSMRIGWVSVVVLVFAACGGSIEPTSGASSSGGTSGSSGTSSGSSGTSSGGGSCSTITVNGSRACVPGTAPANAAITVEVDATEGCLPCGTEPEACKVTIDGTKITLSISAKQCQSSNACAAVCTLPKATCTIPPLALGTYIVEVVGEGPRKSTRELWVTPGAKDSVCTLPPPGGTPEPLDPNAYSRSCVTPDDCVTAITGNVCQRCLCPNTAIAKTSASQYESDYRARVSQCPNPGVDHCAPCQTVKATCEASSCALVPGP